MTQQGRRTVKKDWGGRSENQLGAGGIDEKSAHGRTQRGFEGGSPNPAGGLGGGGGRCEPPTGVQGGAPEDFEINAFKRLRTPVSLSFLSQCCYTKIHAISSYIIIRTTSG